ncbi:hypothetical protein [uncultured Sphingomonas sp.]|uniref:hypothetical protein n=1 Tax=uncultured Sphingomonas sp. TaxID=158754 RepID=UPI0026110E16|nr:hypothetical protein [uncultured Sphingomonas sp.]
MPSSLIPAPDITKGHPMDDSTHSFALETAACLWEVVLDLRDRPVTDPDALALATAIDAAFKAVGAAEMRLTVIGWTGAVDAAWTAVRDNYDRCFDWDFVPEWIVANIDWSDPGRPTIRPPDTGGEEGGDGGGVETASFPEDPMKYPATIQTSVGQSIIGKVGRLFNGTATDVLNLCGITSHAFS